MTSVRATERNGLYLVGGDLDRPALVGGGIALSHGDLAELVAERLARLGTTRRLVMVATGNTVEPIVTYLAALAGGHPVLLVEDGAPGTPAHRRVQSFIDRFDPDVVALGAFDGWQLDERRPGTAHRLHPELALLGSTSGSTGSPKLVRISQENLRSNAASIASYLNLTPDDRAATTLPLHYCYGLSVLNSHLASGASLQLTDRSVTEEAFWDEFAHTGSTSFAGVPYTFDLLDASGFADRRLPDLRYITQAGGRLPPERVREYARLGRARGFDFVVMYGQTEATARMAYLPPQLAETGAGSIGIPIPGGRFRIDAPDSTGSGELVYSGPNVMLGYAEGPDDFAVGSVVPELRTGDLARRRADGLYEIVGRASRFVKVFGLRVDLDQVERLLGEAGTEVRAVAAEERLVLFVRADRHIVSARSKASQILGLPAHAIRVHPIAEFPRTTTGKPDDASLVRYALELERVVPDENDPADAGRGPATPEAILSLYRRVLDRPDATLEDSFASLDGDSLNFVEVSLRLEDLLGGPLPRTWSTMTIGELASLGSPDREASRVRRRMPRVETPALLRALAIVLVVATHADLFFVQGGAHLLLAVTGYNLARFQLGPASGRRRTRALARSIAKVAVPAVLWIGAVAVTTGAYQPTTIFLVNSFGPGTGWNPQWQFWFIEAIVWSMAALLALFAIPVVNRLERRFPFPFAAAVLAAALALRVAVAGGSYADSPDRYVVAVVGWLVVLGWLVARSTTLTHRIATTVVTLLTVPGFMGDLARESIVVAGILLLLWLPAVPVPRPLVSLIGALAGSSLFVYLTQWQVYPPFEQTAPWLGTVLSLVVGWLVWQLYRLIATRAAPAFRGGIGTILRVPSR